MTLLVRDEEDILAANLDFHLQRGVDFIIAMDNCSVDGTANILRAYERRGLLRYLFEPADNYAQSRWVTRMARLASTEYAADWIINSDADEFWYPDQGNLKEVLGGVPTDTHAVVVERTNFVPRRMAPGAFFADVMTVRQSRSLNSLGAPLPSKVCHRGFLDIDVAQGNHSASRLGHTLLAVAAPVTILHFPIRTYQQFANKISKGGAAYERNRECSPEIGATWRKLYEFWQRRELGDWFENSMLNPDEIRRGLRDGSLVFDDRLKQALRVLSASGTAAASVR